MEVGPVHHVAWSVEVRIYMKNVVEVGVVVHVHVARQGQCDVVCG